MSNICQDFGAEIVKILKAIRINEEDKIRLKEKMILPNCLINALSENENSSTINKIGKIPVFGFFLIYLLQNILLRNKRINFFDKKYLLYIFSLNCIKL